MPVEAEVIEPETVQIPADIGELISTDIEQVAEDLALEEELTTFEEAQEAT